MVEKRGSRDTFGGSPVEEACDERSKPQDVTSTWTGREGINLPQEVGPQSAEISPRNSLPKDTAERKSTVEMNIQSASARRRRRAARGRKRYTTGCSSVLRR